MGAIAVRHEPASARLVRHAIAADLQSRSVTPDAVDDVLLVASELIGNAVQHTSARVDGDLDVCWCVDHSSVVVGVTDTSHVLPEPRAWTSTSASGRGLAIVAELSADWGVQDTGHGKQVWARIPIAAAS